MRKLHLALDGDVRAGIPVCAIRGAALYDVTDEPPKVTCYHCMRALGIDPYAKKLSPTRKTAPEGE